MFTNAYELIQFVRKENILQIDLRATDLFGKWHHLTIPAGRLDERFFEVGEAFDSSNMPGFKGVESGDMVLMPDPSTAFIDPFFENRTLAIICDLVDASTREPYTRDPRGLARRAERLLRSSGYAQEALFAPEFEFYLLDDVLYLNSLHVARYEVISREGRLMPLYGGVHHGATLPHKGGYHAVPPEDRFFNVRSEMVRLLEDAGISCRYHHHEVGSMGQQEIEVLLNPPVRSGDISMIVKYFIRNVAARHGLVATFIPKLFFNEAGNGMHFHQCLWSEGTNLFYAEGGYGNLSALAFQYVAGLLLHAPALLALTNPTTNSYRRLVPGHEAPVKAFFSLANRSAAVRIPSYANQPESTRIEFRPPDPTCNPYLAIAAMLLAGLSGISKGLDPTTLGFGPFDENAYDPHRSREIRSLPTSLEDALNALLSDGDFLTAGGVFDRNLLEDWVNLRRPQIEAVRLRPHPFEIEMLLDC